MSVVILGMEMHKKCEDCEIETCDENYYGDESNHRCSLLYKGYTHRCRNEGRLDDCPLRPLPEKHGRLGDLDALRDVQQTDADFFAGSSDYGEKVRYDEALNAVANILNAPTIVEAEGD